MGNLVNKVTDWYFMPRSFEESGKMYEALGVKYFKKFFVEVGRKYAKAIGGFENGRVNFINNYLV